MDFVVHLGLVPAVKLKCEILALATKHGADQITLQRDFIE